MKGKISKIEYLSNNEQHQPIHDYVYDLTIEDNHNFIANNIVVSNCHHIPAQTSIDISNVCKDAYYRIGVSATPWRDAGDDLLIEAVLNKRHPENNISASELIKLGYLVKPTIYFIKEDLNLKEKNYNKLYTNAIVKNKHRNNTIVKIAKNMINSKNSTILILIQRVKHGEILLNLLKDEIDNNSFLEKIKSDKNGKDNSILVNNIEFLSGKDDIDKRKAVLQSVKEKKVKILIGSTIADEGMDCAPLDCLILAGGGRSSTRAYQRIGRVLRLFKNKNRAIVFDFDDKSPILHRHSLTRKRLYKKEPLWDIQYIKI